MAAEAATSGTWSAFTARAELLGAAVMRAESDEAAAALLDEAATRYACTRSAQRRFPKVATHASDAETQDNVVAPAEFAVVETGSVCVNEPPDDRGRCFLAERLWLLVPDTQLV